MDCSRLNGLGSFQGLHRVDEQRHQFALKDLGKRILPRSPGIRLMPLRRKQSCSLVLLYLTLHDGARAWKSFDWESLNRLHAKGLIADPITKAKSVA